MKWLMNVPAEHNKSKTFHIVQDCDSVNFPLIWQTVSREFQLHIMPRLMVKRNHNVRGLHV